MSIVETLKSVVKVLQDKKAGDIEIIKIADVSTIADYLVICSGTSTTQVKALASAVEEKVDREGKMTYHKEGYSTASWVLLDYGDLIVNIFYTEARDFYQLENLWADGETIEIEDLDKLE